MKLQKLVYFSYGFFLGLTGAKLVNASPFAWPFGPVFPRLYKETPKGHLIKEELKSGGKFEGKPESKELISFLDTIWKRYGSKQDFELSALTHREGSPWDIIYNKEGKPWKIIPDNLIKEEFKGI